MMRVVPIAIGLLISAGVLIVAGFMLAGCSSLPESEWGEVALHVPQGETTIESVDSVDAPDDDDLALVRDTLSTWIRDTTPISAISTIDGSRHELRLTLPGADAHAAAVATRHALATLVGLGTPLAPELEGWIVANVAAHDRPAFRSAVRYARELGCTHTCPWCCFCSASHTGCHSPKHDCHKQCLTSVSYMPLIHEVWLVRDLWIHWPGCNSEPFCWPPAPAPAPEVDEEIETGGVPGCGVGWPWCCIGHCGECDGDCARLAGVARAYAEMTGDASCE